MTVTLGRFAKSFATSSTVSDEDCITSVGNEFRILGSLRSAVAGITMSQTATTHESYVVPRGMRMKQTRMVIRPTTSVVNAGSVQGVIKTSWSVQGTATSNLTDTNCTATINTSNFGTDTTRATDTAFNSQVIAPESRIVLRHIEATSSPDGVCDTVVFAREVKPDTN